MLIQVHVEIELSHDLDQFGVLRHILMPRGEDYKEISQLSEAQKCEKIERKPTVESILTIVSVLMPLN